MNLTKTLHLILFFVAASGSAQTLVIRLYDYANLTAKDASRLTEVAGLALAHSGIQAAWLSCRGNLTVTPQPECETPMQHNEIVVRLEPKGPGSTDEERTQHLGHAFVGKEGGSYASIFVPAVRAQAKDFGVAFSLLMGYAVAHEASHCLLGPDHPSSGLMRAAWNRKDSEEMTRLTLHLSKQEARRAVGRLALAQTAAIR